MLARTEGPESSDPVRMCGLGKVTWHLPSSTPVRGQPEAIITVLPDSLCYTGNYVVIEGSVLTWQSEGADTWNLKALPASGWTVSGTIHVDQYEDLNPGEPGRNQRLLSESASGTFTLEAHGPDDAVLRLDDGNFRLNIHVRGDTYNPF